MSLITRQIKIRTPNQGKAAILEVLAAEFTSCVQFFNSRIKILKTTDRSIIHQNCYEDAKSLFPNLQTAYVQQAQAKALSAYSSFVERHKKIAVLNLLI